MSRLTIYCDHITNRLSYSCEVIFTRILHWQYDLLPASKQGSSDGDWILYYMKEPPEECFSHCIQPSGLLWDKGITQIALKNGIHQVLQFPILFISQSGCLLGYDIFSAVFYMVSRYEEYLPFSSDSYGRFPEKLSTSGTLGFTQIPIVHLWARDLLTKLRELYPDIPVGITAPNALFTYDIDVAYAYRGRSFFTHVASLAKNVLRGQFNVVHNKWTHRFGLRSDPSDTYYIMYSNPIPVLYFMLLKKNRTQYDRNLNPRHAAMKALILLCRNHTEVGIHPSYYSMEQNHLIDEEKLQLQTILKENITKSRQHFLRFRMPDTYRVLLKAGITDDYSMQYPEMPGFRAGICVPYPFFDILADSITNLTIHPGCIMDTTFRDDIKIPASESWEWYMRLCKAIAEVGGTFISIWHNDTLWNNLADNHPLAFKQIHQKLIQLVSDIYTSPEKSGNT